MANTKDIISTVVKNGLSKNNRFQIIIPLPSKIQTEERNVSSIGIVNAVRNLVSGPEPIRGLDIMCERAEIPGIEYVITETSYNDNKEKAAQASEYNLYPTMFRLSTDHYEQTIFESWQQLIVNRQTNEVGYKKDYAVDIIINKLDEGDNVVKSITLIDAWPVQVSPVELDSSAQNTLTELNVTFSYKKWIPGNENTSGGLVSSLSQTPLGPLVTPILSNPLVQRGLDFVEDTTGLDLDGEAANIYNNINEVAQSATGQSINKTVGLLNGIEATLDSNDKITNGQKAELSGLITNTVSKFLGN